MFKNRLDAGKQLGNKLLEYRDKDILIFGIPNGGVKVGKEVAAILNKPLHLLIARKLPAPFNPELGLGAIAEDGSVYLYEGIIKKISEEKIQKIVKEQLEVISKKILTMRNNKPLIDMENKIVILVDDGMAIGSTIKVAIECCKKKKAKSIIVAVPVASESAFQSIEKDVNKLVCLEIPAIFYAVSQVYEKWTNLTDSDVINILS